MCKWAIKDSWKIKGRKWKWGHTGTRYKCRADFFSVFCILQTIWIFSMVDYKRPSYNNGEYAYPAWAIGIGWLFASFSIAPIPIFAVIAIVNAKGTTLWEVSCLQCFVNHIVLNQTFVPYKLYSDCLLSLWLHSLLILLQIMLLSSTALKKSP